MMILAYITHVGSHVNLRKSTWKKIPLLIVEAEELSI